MTAKLCASPLDRGNEKGPATLPVLGGAYRRLRTSGTLLPRIPRVLCPRHGNQEERRQEHAQQHVDPDERDIEGAHSEAGNEGSKRPAKAVFHVVVRVKKVEKAPCASYASIS